MTISINHNLSSINVLKNLNKATNRMNIAMERMSTGLRINSSKDGAVELAVSSKMTTKIGSYEQAMRNTEDGMSYLNTAEGALAVIESRLQRMRDLAEQSANGTYGAAERRAMQAEVNALSKELLRVKGSTEYNGIKVFEATGVETAANGVPPPIGGVADTAGSYGVSPKTIEELDTEYGAGNYVTVSTAQELNTELTVNNCSKTIVLMGDIDLNDLPTTAQGNWTARTNFRGTFDGNGYTISNLTINRPTTNAQGFFGSTAADAGAVIKNVTLSNVDVTGSMYTGGLVGYNKGSTITNCSSSGIVSCNGKYAGGLVGYNIAGSVTNSYAICSVTGYDFTGGLVGYSYDSTITSCYATGNVTGVDGTGGLVGYNYSGTVTNSHSTGSVSGGGDNTGGLAGHSRGGIITNCSSSGTVIGNGIQIGGLVGIVYLEGLIENCYATGNVTGTSRTGGLVGLIGAYGPLSPAFVRNSYSTGSVTGTSNTGGLVGQSVSGSTVENSFWDIETGGKTSSAGGTGLTTAQMEDINTYFNAGWDISDDEYDSDSIWYINPKGGSYPAFRASTTFIGKNINLQVGINNDENSVISLTTGLKISNFSVNILTQASARAALDRVDEMLKIITEERTELGAVQNRLQSVKMFQEHYRNTLINNRSTVQDADIAVESSNYIKNQILQNMSATLLTTANQSPSIALQLI